MISGWAIDNGEDIANADKIVFPGQGAALDCMKSLNVGDFPKAIRQATNEKPFLGICMGLQVLFERSEENGGTDCLGVFAGKVSRFKGTPRVGKKIPHMGWSRVKQCAPHPLWEGIDDDSHFYFAHSYYPRPDDKNIVAAKTDYGDDFTCAIAAGPVFAVQFHPEKSAVHGLRLLSNFVRWDGAR